MFNRVQFGRNDLGGKIDTARSFATGTGAVASTQKPKLFLKLSLRSFSPCLPVEINPFNVGVSLLHGGRRVGNACGATKKTG